MIEFVLRFITFSLETKTQSNFNSNLTSNVAGLYNEHIGFGIGKNSLTNEIRHYDQAVNISHKIDGVVAWESVHTNRNYLFKESKLIFEQLDSVLMYRFRHFKLVKTFINFSQIFTIFHDFSNNFRKCMKTE